MAQLFTDFFRHIRVNKSVHFKIIQSEQIFFIWKLSHARQASVLKCYKKSNVFQFGCQNLKSVSRNFFIVTETIYFMKKTLKCLEDIEETILINTP